jgi:hypothetical protein
LKLRRPREREQALLTTFLFEPTQLVEVVAILRWRLRQAARQSFA